MRIFLLGGARSGKSSLAVRWAYERSRDVCCVVTAMASDAEMAARISAHRQERPGHWRVREAPVRLAAALREESRANALLVFDCLTVWTANCLWPAFAVAGNRRAGALGADASGAGAPDLLGWRRERDEFLAGLRAFSGELIVVSNEVGTGVVPDSASARLFCDEHGWLNQAVAAVCDEVFLVTAGLPLRLK